MGVSKVLTYYLNNLTYYLNNVLIACIMVALTPLTSWKFYMTFQNMHSFNRAFPVAHSSNGGGFAGLDPPQEQHALGDYPSSNAAAGRQNLLRRVNLIRSRKNLESWLFM